MNDRHFANFHIAGFTFYDGVEVFEQLKIGVELTAKAEPENMYDPNAVALYFADTKLGFIPRESNNEISKFLKLGYTELFEFKINRVVPEAHTEKQISVVVKIKKLQ